MVPKKASRLPSAAPRADSRQQLLAAFRPLYLTAKRIDERDHNHGGPGSRRVQALCDALCYVETRVEEVWDWGEWERPPGRSRGVGRPLPAAPMKRRPTPPGKMLLEEYLGRARLTQAALARKMGVPAERVNGIVAGRRAVTAEIAILLSRALGTTAEFWMNLQVAADLWDAAQRMNLARKAGLPDRLAER